MTEPDGTEKLAISVREAAAMLSVGRDTIFELVLSGQVPSFKIGARRLIPVVGLREYVDRRLQDEAEGASGQ